MAEVIVTFILVLFICGLLFFILRFNSFLSSIDDSLLDILNCLEVIANKFISKELSYVQQLRLEYSCLHCKFQEQCMADCIAEGTDEFDYLVCENFKEL